ncbi:MAG: acyl-CoA dehydrogenase family protein [Pseudorhodoplanes sp.]
MVVGANPMQNHLDLEAFRSEIRSTLRRVLPDDIRRKASEGFTGVPAPMIRRWQKILFDLGGWSCPNWAKQDGGPGWSLNQQYIFEQELALAGAPRTYFFNHGMIGPAIIEFGTDAQKQKYLRGLGDGNILTCQGYSEPNAGSDLASLKCKAERQGDHYIVNGSKIWTSNGHEADLMFGLFRTDASGKKQYGITLLLVEMNSPGLKIAPIITYEGSHEVNQVCFDNVKVPVENRLGDEHDGWRLSRIILAYERFGTAEVGRSVMALQRLKELAAKTPAPGGYLIQQPEFLQKITDVEIDLRALEVTEQRLLLQVSTGAEASLLKIRGTEIQNRIFELTVEALGIPAIYDVPSGKESPVPFEGFEQATRLFLNMRKTLIYSGSNEIQKNIIARAVLGLR